MLQELTAGQKAAATRARNKAQSKSLQFNLSDYHKLDISIPSTILIHKRFGHLLISPSNTVIETKPEFGKKVSKSIEKTEDTTKSERVFFTKSMARIPIGRTKLFKSPKGITKEALSGFKSTLYAQAGRLKVKFNMEFRIAIHTKHEGFWVTRIS